MLRFYSVTFSSLLLGAFLALSGAAASPPSARDKCPVCGMFVAKYPDWLATVRFSDGQTTYFDGPKDMFRYLTNLPRYAPGRKAGTIAAIEVKDYYGLKPIDARTAFWVSGSDVLGPMGKELIPFIKESEAREFMRDHRGKRLLRFHEITPQLLTTLE